MGWKMPEEDSTFDSYRNKVRFSKRRSRDSRMLLSWCNTSGYRARQEQKKREQINFKTCEKEQLSG